MARVKVVYYQDLDGKVPVLEWLGAIPDVARLRCIARIEQLGTFGHELRRPIADYLGNDLYELRVKVGRMNLRVIYFFSRTNSCSARARFG